MTLTGKQPQLTDIHLLACLLSKMIDDKDDAVVTGEKRDVILLGEVALVLCDVAKAQAEGVSIEPASLHILSSLKADHAAFRAAQT